MPAYLGYLNSTYLGVFKTGSTTVSPCFHRNQRCQGSVHTDAARLVNPTLPEERIQGLALNFLVLLCTAALKNTVLAYFLLLQQGVWAPPSARPSRIFQDHQPPAHPCSPLSPLQP
jgi:hypothetical protein